MAYAALYYCWWSRLLSSASRLVVYSVTTRGKLILVMVAGWLVLLRMAGAEGIDFDGEF